MLSLLACPDCSTANTLKLHNIEDKKKGGARFMQINCRDSEFKHSFYTSPQIDSTKENRSSRMKTMSTLGLYTVSEVSGLVLHHLLSCVVSCFTTILFDKGCIQTSDSM